MIEVRLLIESRCKLGESPVWDERERRLWWVDIDGRAVHRANADGSAHQSWTFARRPTALGLTEQADRLVVAFDDGVYFWSAGAEPKLLVAIEPDEPRTRCNDGRIGPDGAFWIGTMNESDDDAAIGRLWRVTSDGMATCMVDGLRTSNGLAWTTDGRTLFHSDSRSRFIDRYAFDPATGAISERTRIAEPGDEAGRPDGGACDAQGRYWSAGVSAGCLNCYAADGALLLRIPMPIDGPTCPCFGGEDFATLFVTSLRRESSVEEAGGVHALEPGVRGFPAFRLAQAAS
jgi:sugar lactone lactonase YvrE